MVREFTMFEYAILALIPIVGLIFYKSQDFWTTLTNVFHFSAGKWDTHYPKDVVVLHTIAPGKCIPNPSPFVLKVETYLRMTNTPYQLDNVLQFGPKGKTPWITLNGVHVPDSQAIIEFLNTKFEKDASSHLSAKEKALLATIRTTLEEYTFWGFLYWRFIGGVSSITKIMNFEWYILPLVKLNMGSRFRKALWAQGLGRFPAPEIYRKTNAALKNVSILLGDKQFFAGDVPNEDDCAIFGQLAQILYGAPGSPLEMFIRGELPNLVEYVNRMKETYWKDWNEKCITLF